MKSTKSGIAMLLALAAVTISISSSVEADAPSAPGVDIQPIEQIFDSAGNSIDGGVVGTSKLFRHDTRMMAIANLAGLNPGGLYTFWWVVIPEGSTTHPHASFIAKGGDAVIGRNGRANVTMNAESDQQSIEGFPFLATVGGPDNGLCDENLEPPPCFRPLDFDISTAEVHVEVAYHGQLSEMTDEEAEMAAGDFWTGPACPSVGEQSETQPHCPVSFVAIHETQDSTNHGHRPERAQ